MGNPKLSYHKLTDITHEKVTHLRILMLPFLGMCGVTRGRDICSLVFCAAIKIVMTKKGQHLFVAYDE